MRNLNSMELAVADSYIPSAQPFVDGFGERRVITDARGERLEVLRLNGDLSGAPRFESALRDRTARLASFHHESYSRVRTVEMDRTTGAMLVVSDHVAGARLSTLLATAEKRSLPVDATAARGLVRQLVRAAAAWREQMPDLSHGAIGPERIVITPGGRLVIVEHVFGSALEQLPYSRQRYWEELGVLLPGVPGLPIDARADIMQIGATALAVVLGRRLTPEDFPRGTRDALSESDGRPRFERLESLPASFRDWLMRALQIDTDRSFASVIDARETLEEGLGAEDPIAERDAVQLFLARCLVLDGGILPVAAEDTPSKSPAPGEQVSGDDMPDVDLGTRIEALKTFLAHHPPRPAAPPSSPSPSSSPSPPEPVSPRADAPRPDAPPAAASPVPSGRKRRMLIAAGVGGGIILIGALLAMAFRSPAAAESTGELSIVTTPEGVTVLVDGTERGVTPLGLDVPAGDHVVELVSGEVRRRIPVTVRAGGQVSHFIELSDDAATGGRLQVTTDPPNADVTIDGRSVGRSPVNIEDLPPGTHTVVLRHEGATTVTEQVEIEAGRTATLVVPLLALRSDSAGAGWISVRTPVDVQIFENGRFLGSSRIDRIMMPAGRHELEMVNEELRYRQRQAVRVATGEMTAVSPAWPTGALAINAVPWAEVTVNGRPAGETPIGNIQLPIGVHEIVFRHPELGERRRSVTVTAGEASKIGVDMRAQ